MSILNTWWLIFRSNAKDVIQGNKDILKSTKETERALKDTNEEAQNLGENFVKTVEAAASFAGAIAGFHILKTGIQNTADLNKNLTVMSQLLNQNAQSLDSLARAAEAAGGSYTGALGDMGNIAQAHISAGLPVPPIGDYLDWARGRIKGMTSGGKIAALQAMNINDPGWQRALSRFSNEEYEHWKKDFPSNLTPANQQSAMEKQYIDSKIGNASKGYWSNLLTDISGAYNSAGGGWAGLVNAISQSKGLTIGTGAGIGLGGIALGKGAAAALLRKGGTAAAEAAAARSATTAGVDLGFSVGGEGIGAAGGGLAAAGAAPLGLLAAGVGMAGYGAFKGYHEYLKLIDTFGNYWRSRGGQKGNLTDGMAPAAVPGMGLTLPLKGGKNPAMDMNVPSDDDILNSPNALKTIQRAIGGKTSGIINGQNALSLASAYPSLGNLISGNSVKIDKIEINTQATDAAGIANDLKDEIYSQLSILAANHDDGRDR